MIYSSLEEANNPILFSEDDIYINFDKFKSGESKIVQITGLSGSGKSTLAKEISEKYNAYLIETDTICFAIAKNDENATWDYIKKKDKYLYQYMKEKNLPANFMRKYDFKTVTLKEADKRDHEGVKFLKWLYFEANVKEPVVVEGGCVAFAISVDDSFLQIPTIFKGTSIITSLFRRFNRSSDRQGILLAAKNAAKFYVKQYSKMIPEVNSSRSKFFDRDKELPVFISDNEDIYINFNKFKDGIINKCLILGLSGSGKSTLADKLAKKYHVEHVNLDRIRGNKYYTDEEMKKSDPSIYKWLTTEFDQPRETFNALPKDIRKKEWERCFYWLLSSKKPMIIEGHFTDILKVDERLQKEYPIIFKRTSMSKSIYRMLHRELTREHRENIPIVKWLLKHIPTYTDAKKNIDDAMHSVMKHNPTDYQQMHEMGDRLMTEESDNLFVIDKYGNKRAKGDSIYTGMDSNADENTWIKKIEYVSLAAIRGGKPQPCIKMNGGLYRARSEVIVLDKTNRILIDRKKNRANFGYDLPGGGIDPGESIVHNAYRECEEEALIIPENIQFMNIVWFLEFNNQAFNKGAVNFICVARKGKEYKGKIKNEDKDEFADDCVWVNYKQIKLGEPHKLAIERYLEIEKQHRLVIPKSAGYDKDETNYYLGKVNSIKEFNEFLNKNFDYGYVYNYETGNPKRSKDVDFSKYKTVDTEIFATYRIGVCWDYTNYEAFVFSKKFQYKNISKGKLKNNTFSTYFIQFESANGKNPTHTWLGYMKNNKVYSFESSWETYQGIKEFDSEEEMIDYYWKEHKAFSDKRSKTGKGLVCKFTPFVFTRIGEVLSANQYINYIYDHGCVIKSEFKEYPVNKVFKNLTEDLDTIFLDTEYEVLEEEAKISTHTKIPYKCEVKMCYYSLNGPIKNGQPNLILYHKNKRWRVRSEILLFKDDKIFIHKENKLTQYGTYYRVPGGGIDSPNEYIEDAAARECQEETLIIPKNVRYSNRVVFKEYEVQPWWHAETLNKNGIWYDGAVTFICTGEYDKKYNKYVRKIDRDTMKEGHFYTLEEVKDLLSKDHLYLFKEYLKMKNSINSLMGQKLHEFAIMDTTFLDTEYTLVESAGYKEAKVVYDSLSEKDKELCSPRGRYVDSDNIAYRYVYKINNHPVGFIDCYKFNHSNHSAFIILAVHPTYRGKGIGKLMLKKAEENCKLLGFQKLIYRIDKKNISSKRLVASYPGFVITSETKNQITYSKLL